MSSDPGLFRAYLEHPEPEKYAECHYEEMVQQLAAILREGEVFNEWQVRAFEFVAKALLDATAYYHHPYFLMYGHKDPKDMDYLLDWFLKGLQATRFPVS